MATLNHPCKDEIGSIRKIMLGVHPSFAEGIKWNTPSFRTVEYFVTTNLRAKSGIGMVLHLGAKVRELPTGFSIADPTNLLKWLGKDRATVEISNLQDIADNKTAFESVIRNGSVSRSCLIFAARDFTYNRAVLNRLRKNSSYVYENE